jgi:hypothetical protein
MAIGALFDSGARCCIFFFVEGDQILRKGMYNRKERKTEAKI